MPKRGSEIVRKISAIASMIFDPFLETMAEILTKNFGSFFDYGVSKKIAFEIS